MSSAPRLPKPVRTGISSARHRERGSALFLLLILSVVMATVLAGIFSYIHSTAMTEKRSNIRTESTYAAEYAFELAYQRLNSQLMQSAISLPDIAKTTAVTNLSTAPTDIFSTDGGYSWKSYLTIPIVQGVPAGTPNDLSSSQGNYKYLTVVEFTRKIPPMETPVHMQFQREWDFSITPLFQYAIFYNSDMELFPGAAFNVGGKVHSNGKIYTGTSASITFSDYVTDVNGVSNHYKKPEDPRTESGLTGTITYNKANPIVSSAQNPPGQFNSNTTDTNYNNDGPHELIEIPNIWQTDDNSGDRMYNKAGLKFIVNTNTSGSPLTADNGDSIPAGTGVLYTKDGTRIGNVTLSDRTSSEPLAQYIAQNLFNKPSTLPDYREGKTMNTIEVNVANLTSIYSSGYLPQTVPSSWGNGASVPATLRGQSAPAGVAGKDLWNGVLYVTDIANTATHRSAVVLTQGTKLPDGSNASGDVPGLTVVTANAAYIWGDFNTGGTPPVNSSSSLTAANYASGYTVQPAAVMADAVTVLSNNWQSSYTLSTSLNSRTASNTTVNTALISGVVASDGTAYSGGVENYIRLLESWSSKRLTYYGSMINVYDSQQSTAHWQTTGNYYNAPARNWYFDVNFLDPNKLPPGTPVLRSLKRGQWVQIE